MDEGFSLSPVYGYPWLSTVNQLSRLLSAYYDCEPNPTIKDRKLPAKFKIRWHFRAILDYNK